MTSAAEAAGIDDAAVSAALGLRPCDLAALRSIANGSSPGEDTPPLRVRDLVHSRLRSAVCDDMLDPRKLMTARPRSPQRSVAGLRLTPLPEPDPLPEVTLAEAIERRHSSTTFSSEPLPLATLAALLEGAAGVRDRKHAYNVRDFPFRRSPSAGGLAPVDIYLVSNSVAGLPQGLYYYRPLESQLATVDTGVMRAKLAESGIAADWLFYAPVVLMLAISMPRVEWKYGVRSYRYVHVDLGVLTQNLYLIGTALGLSTCAVAAFDDDAANDLARLDGRDEFISLMFACGSPSGR
jgi:SagB-type dehydrogenase family enzyme